ncbi:Protein of unknown function [Nitrosomonas sp. Nm51]|uniref:DUF3618 domain-containing protein n=1 Tax=Nitrosomonas sp. Nm51 TaxID=133720 RepID=UPI0008B533AB|nr:DUF3618 domain-containing protein [Nitrosomonas sp. Nm51]SEQ74679.1 Protein of unknown function [Nitrosomonas sp. Nm51]
MDNNYKDPQTIETEIEKTRQHMRVTLEEINGRLSPDQLLDRAFEYISDKILRNNINTASLTETAKKNPVATALIGLGVGWLIVSGKSAGNQGGTAEDHKDSSANAVTDNQLKNNKYSTAGNANNKQNADAENAKEKVTQQNDSQAEHSLHKLHEQPFVLIGAGLALGAALGAYLSSARRDEKPFKKSLEKQIDQAAETGNEQLEKVKEAVSSAVETISQAVDEVSSTTDANEDNNRQNSPEK